MKLANLLCVFLLASGLAQAADIAKDPGVFIEGAPDPKPDKISGRFQIAIVGIYEDGLFEDLVPLYAAAWEEVGMTVDTYYDPGGLVDYSPYELVLVNTADNWYNYDGYPAEIAAWRAYLDSRRSWNALFLIGQDFVYGAGQIGLNFLSEYMDVSGVAEDLNYADAGMLEWWGGGWYSPFFDMEGDMYPCFTANDWFTDGVTADYSGLIQWRSPFWNEITEGGAVNWNGIFSSVELACDDFDTLVDLMWRLELWWHLPAVQPTSFSEIKSLY